MFPLISEAHAQAASAGGDGSLTGFISSSPLGQFLPLILIFVVFYFIMIRPQQQEQKKLKERLAAVKRGDRVLTAGGIIGVVQKSREGTAEIEVEIAPNVRVMVLRDTLTSVLSDTAPVAANTK
jgi:preprotein translocase subunit YajC